MKKFNEILFLVGSLLITFLAIIAVALFTLTFYVAMALVVFWGMAKSYVVLGNTLFFVVWPVIIVIVVAYGIIREIKKKDKK
jgi:hypothetical protein